MVKKKSGRKTKTFSEAIGLNYIFNERCNFIYGIILLAIALYIIIAFCSYLNTGADDQSLVNDLQHGDVLNTHRVFHNYCGSWGAILSDFFINRCFGLASFLIPFYLILYGLKALGVYQKINLWKWFFGTMVVMIWSSVTLSKFLSPVATNLIFDCGGNHGAYICRWLENIIGSPGLVAVLVIVALAFLTYLTQETIRIVRLCFYPMGHVINHIPFTITNDAHKVQEPENQKEEPVINDAPKEVPPTVDTISNDIVSQQPQEEDVPVAKPVSQIEPEPQKDEVNLEVRVASVEDTAKGKTVEGDNRLDTPINPREPWMHYKFPTLDLLKRYDTDGQTYVDRQEQEANKNHIIQVLRDFGVEIKSIRATVGPTITLYEITPAQGVRISKIRNLEDDIALSLAALGIRIIAPIPGKGTIGIEVPNANPNIVSMLSILNSKKFQDAKMDLPIALGKTITNDVFMVDLAKVPHLLVAGATGQGKSVGLNAIITSLLYKKHPNELKIVLVDPKKVEFSVYAPIADHFMAALEENEDEPIITDVTKVVKTLKGLCVLMDQRYDMLKRAGARNIKEYNAKYLSHKLNPNDGHEYMPYIVIVIDEFGDLIMTAGREIEMPITRIAQLARAVGMHMVIATQRPTTNIITGSIKANFPGRIAFRVGAMVDSRTILDRPGAQQLIGRGDMLYLNGREPVRVQCAFVDTPEVERINRFIADQSGPLSPMVIPEPLSDDGGSEGTASVNVKELDSLFADAARLIVRKQSGSTSLLQRMFSIGYNRSGRLMDQIEKAGIVGPAQGSKPREVLISDETTLDNLLSTLH